MGVDQAVFLRIDTTNSAPYLEGEHGKIVADALLKTHRQNWFKLIGFVVLPAEVQVLFIPRFKAINDLLAFLEIEVRPHITALPSDAARLFDPDIYREKVDSSEEVQQRLRWMHLAPVRARLITMYEAYPYSSANAQYKNQITSLY